MPIRLRRALGALFLALFAVSGLTACGDDDHYDARPPAVYGANGYCYYLDDPAEVFALQAAGLCPSYWSPMVMPSVWHQRYYGYYSSPTYVNRYVVVSHRSAVKKRESVFAKTYSKVIKKQQAVASHAPKPTAKAAKIGGGDRKGNTGVKPQSKPSKKSSWWGGSSKSNGGGSSTTRKSTGSGGSKSSGGWGGSRSSSSRSGTGRR